jgi:arginine N-succinyltransferase
VFRVREAEAKDLDQLHLLSKQAVFLNLPADRNLLTKKISRSQASFRGKLRDDSEGEYFFVLEDLEEGKVVGSATIIAKHGTPNEPHSYFQVVGKKKLSKSLHIGFLHQVLRMGFNFDGPTEIGGLVLLPEYRGHAEKLGKFLSFCRFMYIAARRPRFEDQLLSELMPPFNDRGESPIWEEIGRKFTNLRYDEADRLSRRNKEFITSLFPEGDIYTCMLAGEARAAIGEVGEETRPVKRMLENIGFRYTNMIDPFDGGPHMWAKTSAVLPVKNTKHFKLIESKSGKLGKGIEKQGYVMCLSKSGLRVIQGSTTHYKSGVMLSSDQRKSLAPDSKCEVYFLEMPS